MFEKARVPETDEAVESEETQQPTTELTASNSGVEAKAQAARRKRGVGAPQSPVVGYEQLLGSTLGPKLYSSVSDLITLPNLAGYARSALGSGLGSLGDKAKLSDSASSADIDQAVNALEQQFGPMAHQYVMSNGFAFQQGLQDFVDANPLVITTLAMLAAAAAVVADMPLPEFKHTLQLADGLDMTAGVELGTLQHLTVERIRARLSYRARDLSARIETSYRPDNEKSNTEFGFDYRVNDNLDVYGRGRARDPMYGGLNDQGDHSGRVGVQWRPKKDMEVDAYGEMSEERGAGAGVNFRWKF